MSDQIDKWKDDVGPGWLPLIEVLDRQLRRFDPDYRIEQVKEKFGGLRYYIITSDDCTNTDRMYAVIDAIESLSFRICENCGRPGEIRKGGWIRTLCDECEGGAMTDTYDPVEHIRASQPANDALLAHWKSHPDYDPERGLVFTGPSLPPESFERMVTLTISREDAMKVQGTSGACDTLDCGVGYCIFVRACRAALEGER